MKEIEHFDKLRARNPEMIATMITAFLGFLSYVTLQASVSFASPLATS